VSTDRDATARHWLHLGQTLETVGDQQALADAIGCYDEALATLRSLTRTGCLEHQRAVGLAWMNRGNALLKQNTWQSLSSAVLAYDQAIEALIHPTLENDFPARNSRGAAWMNRGLALHRRGGPDDLKAAIVSHHEAVTALSTLPLDENPWYRRNLAAARINLANALLDDVTADNRLVAAANSGRAALALVAVEESEDPLAAELALKARRCLCDAFGQLLPANESSGRSNAALVVETSDTIDAALALIRTWERRRAQNFRPLAERFFRFGALFYQVHQPHFLREFILENLDPGFCTEALTAAAELHVIAEAALTRALDALQNGPPFLVNDPASLRRRDTIRAIQQTRARLAELTREPPYVTLGIQAATSSSP
jgi:hypothetical protein